MSGLRRGALVALAGLLVASLTACGGNDDGASPTPAASRSTSGIIGRAPADSPIRLMSMTPQTGDLTYPEVLPAARAAAGAINADGGVKGHRIEIVDCDTHGTAAGAQDCARRAVSEKVSAVVGAVGPGAEAYLPILTEAGIPTVANLADSRIEATDPLSFPLHATALDLVGLAATLQAEGATSVQLLGPDTRDFKETLEVARGLLPAGVALKGSTLYPLDGDGFSDDIERAYGGGADAVGVVFAGSRSVSEFAGTVERARISLGKTPTATLGTTFRPSALGGGAGKGLDGLLVVSGGQTANDDKLPSIRTFQLEYATQSGQVEYTDLALAAWVGVHAIAKVLRKATGDITTAQSLRRALAVGPIDFPGWMPFDFSAPALTGELGQEFPRVGTSTVWVGKVSDGRLRSYVTEPQPISGPIELP